MRELYVIAHDMRSTYNVGSLFRTAEGLGVKKLYLTGYTPYPSSRADERLPHVALKLDTAINKTALGATKTLRWKYEENIYTVLKKLNDSGITVVALEQSLRAIQLPEYKAPEKVAILLGTEVSGLPKELLKEINVHVFIPMFGAKESFNVVQAAAMALYQLRFHLQAFLVILSQ